MSRAGVANEGGSAFRINVATHLAVHGLRGIEVPGMFSPDIYPVHMLFETSDPTDDIVVAFSDGSRGYVSAKRKVGSDKALRDTVKGWLAQIPAMENNDFLIIAAEEFAGPVKHLSHSLSLWRKGVPFESEDDKGALKVLEALIPEVHQAFVLTRARVLHVPNSTKDPTVHALHASYMQYVLDKDQSGKAAIGVLSSLFHAQAGVAAGSGISEWVQELHRSGIKVLTDVSGPAGSRIAALEEARRYFTESLLSCAGAIDLSLLADDVGPVVVHGLIDGMRVNSRSDEREEKPLLSCVRRWRSLLLVGQPGAGKSVALRELAAACARNPDAPLPLRIDLPRLIQTGVSVVNIDTVIEAAASSVAADKRPALAAAIRAAIDSGDCMLLFDGLDECGNRAPWVAQQLRDLRQSLPVSISFVVATRASSEAAARKMELPRTELMPPKDLSATIDLVLESCAAARINEELAPGWLETRRAWMSQAKDDHADLFEVPLLAILVALICADAADSELPTGRARLLHHAVGAAVVRWERQRGQGTYAWSPDLTSDMLLAGYVTLGRLLGSGRAVTREEAIDALRSLLTDPERWRRSPGDASTLAKEIFRFWDEVVAVFVADPRGTVVSRSRVFTEIASAMWVLESTQEQAEEWLAGTLTRVEDVMVRELALGIDPRLPDLLLGIRQARVEALLVFTQAAVRGVFTPTVQQVEKCLQLSADFLETSPAFQAVRVNDYQGSAMRLRHMAIVPDHDAPAGERLVIAIGQLSVPPTLRTQRDLLFAKRSIPHRSAQIARALADLTDARVDFKRLSDRAAADVNEVLGTEMASSETRVVRESRRKLRIYGGSRLPRGVSEVALMAAGHLEELGEGAAQKIYKIGERSNIASMRDISAALHLADVDTSAWRVKWVGDLSAATSWMEEFRGVEKRVLEDMAALTAADLPKKADKLARWSLQAAGQLLHAIGFAKTDFISVGRLLADTDALRHEWLSGICVAFGIDRSAVSEQAAYLLGEAVLRGDAWLEREWEVLLVEPPNATEPTATGELDAHEQASLVQCLEAKSDLVAYSAANVLLNIEDPAWDCSRMFERDLTAWPIDREALHHLVAIACAGDKAVELLVRAAGSQVGYRRAARWAVELKPELDPSGEWLNLLRSDPDLTVRQPAVDKSFDQPPATQWSCPFCRAVNPIRSPDCQSCTNGARPD